MAMRFFLAYEGQVIQLPVNPEDIELNSDGDNKTENIVKLGEVNMLRDMRLKTIEIECFLPQTANNPYVLTTGQFEPPQFYIDFINKIRTDKKPFRFIISDTSINLLMAIEDFEYSFKAGDPDIHYKLSLREYRPFSAKTVKIELNTDSGEDANKMTAVVPERPKTGFSIGDTVTANGKYFYTSYGENPFGTFSNFVGKISHIVADKSRKLRYHITDLEGGYKGWLTEGQIVHK